MRLFPIKQDSPAARPWAAEDDFNRLLSAFWGEVAQPVPGYTPRLDVREDADAVVVKVDLPGVDRQDLSLALEQGVLTLRGQRHAEHSQSDEKRGWHRLERHWGSFERQLRLGEGYAADKVKAELKNGVLSVTIPKQEQSKPRSIEIQ